MQLYDRDKLLARLPEGAAMLSMGWMRDTRV